MGSKTKIRAIDLRKEFGDVVAIDCLNLEIKENEFAVVVGPSGCGKSTLLYLIAGFEKPTSGKILLNDEVIRGPGPDRGFVFQEFMLYPWKNVLSNIMFGLEIQGIPKKEAREKAMFYVRMIGLEGFEDKYPHELSGGMKQRVGIARALAYDPEVLLMDEPFGALDAQTKKIMQGELLRIWNETKKTVVYVTHSVIEAAYLADRVFVLTSRPSRLKGIIEIDIPRPRDYTSDEFLDARKKILDLLEEEVVRTFREDMR
ncbi:MAG: ABC transporter ATP-binding protein [Candidatus Hydrothermarchaeota archaeon]